MTIADKLRKNIEMETSLLNILEQENDEELMVFIQNPSHKEFLSLNTDLFKTIVNRVRNYLSNKTDLKLVANHLIIDVYDNDELLAKLLLTDGLYVLRHWQEENDYYLHRYMEMSDNTLNSIEEDAKILHKQRFMRKRKRLEELDKLQVRVDDLSTYVAKKTLAHKMNKGKITLVEEKLIQLGFKSPFDKTDWFRMMRFYDNEDGANISKKVPQLEKLLSADMHKVLAFSEEDMRNFPEYNKSAVLVFTIPMNIFESNKDTNILYIHTNEASDDESESDKENEELKLHFNNTKEFLKVDVEINCILFEYKSYIFYMNNLGFILGTPEGIKYLKTSQN